MFSTSNDIVADRGGTGEAGWTLRANHGGGYNYRLAPLGAPLTEATFNKIPLDFVGPSILRWDRNESSQLAFNTTERGWDTRVGTTPPNSMWRKNPIPHIINQWDQGGPAFDPPCEESAACKALALQDGLGPQELCRCSGEPANLEIIDTFRIPTDIKPGKCKRHHGLRLVCAAEFSDSGAVVCADVLNWRWDCEEGAQIWNSCVDITVV